MEYGSRAGPTVAVDGVGLVVNRGEILGLVGESGSGKTTLAAALLGLLPQGAEVAGGRVWFRGRDLTRLSPGELRRVRGLAIGYIPQGAMGVLNPLMRAADQVAEGVLAHADVGRATALRRARDLLARVGIPPERAGDYPHQLSGGMRQRVVIATALANDPELIVADEPTTGLDAGVRGDLLDLLARLRRELGASLVLISHDLDAVLSLADRVAVMRSGRVVEEGRASEVAAAPRHAYTRSLFAELPPMLPATGAGGRLLEVARVSKTFRVDGGRLRALEDVGLEVGRGDAVGIVGSSGAGKTTLARIIAGLDRPDRGSVLFEGHDLAGVPPRRRGRAARRMHLVFQDPYDALPPGVRVLHIIGEPLRVEGRGPAEQRRRALEALQEVGLTPPERFAARLPHQLSGGERQRVALARAVVARPALILADEPVEMLDAPLRSGLLRLMQRLGGEHGVAYLYITHDPRLVRAMCRRVVVLRDGRVVEDGDTEAIWAGAADEYTAALLRCAVRPVGDPSGV